MRPSFMRHVSFSARRKNVQVRVKSRFTFVVFARLGLGLGLLATAVALLEREAARTLVGRLVALRPRALLVAASCRR